jgi:hypothetical protein
VSQQYSATATYKEYSGASVYQYQKLTGQIPRNYLNVSSNTHKLMTQIKSPANESFDHLINRLITQTDKTKSLVAANASAKAAGDSK